jgi:DMSO/TMAO reductase YedYZ molybdopterin-dependent catalytic subunit
VTGYNPKHGDDLIVVSRTPFNAETPPRALDAAVTSSRHVYVRSNFGIPSLRADDHRVAIGGSVERPHALTMADLRALPQRTVTATMECAGNDRTQMRPLPAGEPWQGGAVSTVRWAGVPLRAVLERASIASGTVEIMVEGADAGARPDAVGTVAFARSLPLADALDDDVLLAMSMNGEPLTALHGAPVRLVVPGYYGMASVKWVTRVEAMTAEYAGYFQRQRYVYVTTNGTTPVRRMQVKSLIVAPADGERVVAGLHKVSGWAWSGSGRVSEVMVYDGGGPRGVVARVSEPDSPHAWSRWETEIELRGPGRHVLRSRATDIAGNTQPDEAPWNQLGYGNNAVRAVTIDVVDA